MSFMTLLMWALTSTAWADDHAKKLQRGMPIVATQHIAQFDINPFVDQQRAMRELSKHQDNSPRRGKLFQKEKVKVKREEKMNR